MSLAYIRSLCLSRGSSTDIKMHSAVAVARSEANYSHCTPLHDLSTTHFQAYLCQTGKSYAHIQNMVYNPYSHRHFRDGWETVAVISNQ